MHDLTAIDPRKTISRVALGLAAIFTLLFGWYSIRNQLGNLLATITSETDPNLLEIAQIAKRLAPDDPAAFALAASATDTLGSVEELQKAVQLASADFRWRTDLGRAYEQNGDITKAEEQLLAAVRLAPNYSYARWHLGNFYLRQEQTEKALRELKVAAENSPAYREQVFSLVWDYSGKDPAILENVAADRPDMKARLAYFFAARGRAPEALRNWNRLTDSEKQANGAIARAIAMGLFDQKHFAEALEFARQYGAETEAVAGAVTNGGFEKALTDTEESKFGWTVLRGDSKIEVAPDSRVKKTGGRGLRVNFKGFAKLTFSNVLQTVVVEPGARYRLTVFVRTENLRSAGMPMIEILSANDDKTLARSQPFATGTNDWQELTIELTVPAGTSGVTIRTIRDFCGEDCPITGLMWYDDFVLTKL
jgi:tetratricopeptide (TPR) repeat protein